MSFIPRTSFPKHTVTLANFHGHHRKALEAMYKLAPQVDLVLELRDSRAPLTSMNGLFSRILGHKPRIVIYTKLDQSPIDPSVFLKWHESHDKFLTVDCRNTMAAQAVLKAARNMYNEMIPPPPLGIRLLVAGMPNVGKSTFLNTLRRAGGLGKHKVAQTGEMPGVTRSVSETVCISRNPNLYLLDTPGVFVPQVQDSEDMIKLCLINSVKQSHIDPVVLADYLLYRINLQYPDGKPYLKYTGKPTNSIAFLLKSMAKHRHEKKLAAAQTEKSKNVSKPRKFHYVESNEASQWINKWSRGKLVKLLLDDVKGTAEEYRTAIDKQNKFLEKFNLNLTKADPRKTPLIN